MQAFLSEDILLWQPEYDGGRKPDASRVERSFQLLAHAQSLVQVGTSELSLADAISNLKRAINVRLQHLEDLYALSRRFPKNVGALERLEAIGLARPFLIRQLFELRNEVEHNDAPPPTQSRCLELVDIAWYFLKTTEYACRTVPEGVVLKCHAGLCLREPPLWVGVRLFKNKPETAEVVGWLSPAQLLDQTGPARLSVNIHTYRPKREFNSNNDAVSQVVAATNAARGEDERWIQGEVTVPPRVQHLLIKLALQTL